MSELVTPSDAIATPGPAGSVSVGSVSGNSVSSGSAGSDIANMDDFLPGKNHLENPNMPACAYCNLQGANSVVKCGGCDKWFCNSKFHGTSSHIITHLVLSRHKSVALHEDLDLGDTELECYACGNKNVFVLGFVSARQELVVVILCRLPCGQQQNINWDTGNWQPLIEDRALVPFVAAPALEADLVALRPVDPAQMSRLEAQWRLHREATIEDITNDTAKDTEVLPILMRYTDPYQYQNVFAPLVQVEADCDRATKESQALERILVSWELGPNNCSWASFSFSTFDLGDIKVTLGDEVILRHGSGTGDDAWEAKGYIVRLPNAYQEHFTLEVKTKTHPQTSTNYTAEFVWKGTTYERMHRALNTFATDTESVSAYIYHKLLGHEVEPVQFDVTIPEKLLHPLLPALNASQANAVRSVLKNPLSLIQGPPGTGKTLTSTTIVYQLHKLHSKKVLVCAPSNVAVDHLASKLDLLGLKVVRIVAKLREDVENSDDNSALHKLVRKNAKGQLRKLIRLRDEAGDLQKKDLAQYFSLVRKEEMSILKSADVVCCTCVGAGDYRLKDIEFRSVLVDESTQASEPEVLIPIVKGAKHVILVGDHQQLGPVIMDKRAGDAGLKQSLFERLVVLGHVPLRLEVQYRMHPALSEFSSNMFYEGSLLNGVTAEQRTTDGTFPWPLIDLPMMFWVNYGREEISSSGCSYLNRIEAMNVEKIVTRLFKDGVLPHQIGVITPYEGQRAFLLQYLSMNSTLIDKRDEYLQIEVTSVDAFQGREKDYIILSCVRANEERTIGFLRDPRRLNVALTRAKYGLIVLGNPRALCRNTLWNYLLLHYRERGCLVEGTLDNLQISMVPLTNKQNNSIIKKTQNHRADFDTASLLSYAGPGPIQLQGNTSMEEQWPSLSKMPNEYDDTIRSRIHSNLNDRLNDRNLYENPTENIDLRSITGAFAAGLNL